MCFVLGVRRGSLANFRQALLSSYTFDFGKGLSDASDTISLNDFELVTHLGFSTCLLNSTSLISYSTSQSGMRSLID